MKLDIEVSLNKRAMQLLEKVPLEIQGRVGAKALTAGVREIRRALKPDLPNSRKTGTRKKWSKKMRQKAASWRRMANNIKVYNLFRKGLVSAKLWVPGLAWFEYGFTNKLWGSGKTMEMPGFGFMRRAIDSSKRSVQTKIVKTLTKELRKIR